MKKKTPRRNHPICLKFSEYELYSNDVTGIQIMGNLELQHMRMLLDRSRYDKTNEKVRGVKLNLKS